MTNEQLVEIGFKQQLEAVTGIKENNVLTLHGLKENFAKALDIGFERQDKNMIGKDGGLMAIDTGIEPLKLEDIDWLKPGSVCFVCAVGGTNWEMGIVKVVENGMTEYGHLQTLKMRDFTRDEAGGLKQYSASEISKLIGEKVFMVLQEAWIDPAWIDALAIAFGFAQDNQRLDYGVEARLNSDSSCKDWQFVLEEGKQPFIGQGVIRFLTEATRGKWRAETVAIGNDTNQTANDLTAILNNTLDESGAEILNMGLVAGTGNNICIDRFNLESGDWLINSDPALEKLHQLGRLQIDYDIAVYKTGGKYLIDRLGAAVLLMGETGLLNGPYRQTAEQIFRAKGGELSHIAKGEIEFKAFNQKDMGKIQLMARMILDEAADLIAAMTLAAAEAAGYDSARGKKGLVLAEGSVLWKGYGVKEKVEAVIRDSGGNLGFIKARSLIGAGLQALVEFGRTIYY